MALLHGADHDRRHAARVAAAGGASVTAHPYLLGMLAILGWALILLTAADLWRNRHAGRDWRPSSPRDGRGPI